VVLQELFKYTLQFLLKVIFHIITFIISWCMAIQNNNIILGTFSCYIQHPVTNKFHPLNCWYAWKACPWVMISIPISEKCIIVCWLTHPEPIWPLLLPLDLVIFYKFTCYCFQWTCPVETPNISCSKSTYFLLHSSFHRLCSIKGLCNIL
jgi:hypothetical protein